ncbi:MAG: murein biosynthesis integral membrane protein MurJ [Actinomycetota bacterium]
MADDSAGLIRSSSLMGLGTIISRITGLVRNLLLVAVLGTGILGDAYNVANTTPNIIYNLLIGGALSAVFVPQIVKSFRNHDGGSEYVSRLVSLLASALLVITSIAMVLAPLFISIYAPSFSGRSRDVTIAFALYCLPQILFYGLFGVLGQVANAKEKFGPMMWAPIANNVVVITLFTYFLSVTDEISLQTISDDQVRLLGIGTTLGIALQALILIPSISATGLRLRFRTDWRGVGLDKAIKLASWMFLFVLISQLGFLVTVNLATRAGVAAEASGVVYGVGYTPYANAYLILLLPHSIVTISIVTALLPKLSNFAIDKKIDEVRSLLDTALRYVGIITVPASFFFLLFGERVAQALFFGVSDESALFVGRLLSAMAIGLIPLSINLVLIRGLNAFENTKYQVISNLIINLVAVALSLIAYTNLEARSVSVGLALAFTASYWIGIIVTYVLLKKFTGALRIAPLALFYIKVALASSIAVVSVAFMADRLDLDGNFVALVGVLITTSLLYIVVARAMKIAEVGQTIKVLLRR